MEQLAMAFNDNKEGTGDNWIGQKLSQHSRDISRLRERAASIEVRQQALEDRNNYMVKFINEIRAEIKSDFNSVSSKVEEVLGEVNRTRGGINIAAWIIGTLLIGLGTISAILTMVHSFQ